MSRFSGPNKFRTSITDRLRAAWSGLPWPSPGAGEADDPTRNQALFRSYQTGRNRSAYPEHDPNMTRPDIETDIESVPITIPFVLIAALNQRRMAVSPMILGPSIIENIELEINVAAGASNAVFSLFVSETPEIVTTITPRPSGADLFSNPIIGAGVNAPDDSTGLVITEQGAPRLLITHFLHSRINIDRFFIKPSLVQTSGTLITVAGYINVLRQVGGLTLPGSKAYRGVVLPPYGRGTGIPPIGT